MVDALTQFPKLIQGGISFRATVVSDMYQAPSWSVTAHLRGPASIDITATGTLADHEFTVPAAVTAGYAPGQYAVSVRATDGTDVFEIEAGTLDIVADIAAQAAGHDPRGHAERVLSAIEAVIEGRATKDQNSYKINNRELVRTTIAELLELRKTYRHEVARLKNGGRNKRLLRRQVRVKY